MNKTLTSLLLTLPFQVIAQSNSLKSPQNLSPAHNAKYMQTALITPLNFKWKPLTPTQEAPITYRLKIWQLKMGQGIAQAMKLNKPLIIKDVKFYSQAEISNLTSEPCTAPNQCKFVWTVQALWLYGEATSKPTTFSIENKPSL